MGNDAEFLSELTDRPIGRDIDLNRFECEPGIDAFLREKACEHHEKRISTVTCWLNGPELAGYITTSMALTQFTDSKWWRLIGLDNIEFVAGAGAQKRFPAMQIGMLGVDKRYRSKGLARLMVKRALVYAMDAASTIGCRIVFVESLKNDDAISLYRSLGFSAAAGQDTRPKLWMYLDLGLRQAGD